jgi:uncharacterized protein YuzE
MDEVVIGRPCVRIEVDEDVCYIQLGTDRPRVWPKVRHTKDLGMTARGEMVLMDVDADGRILGFELIGGKPCQGEVRGD